MARHVDDVAARHLADLVDAVGELVAAVLDMDAASAWERSARSHRRCAAFGVLSGGEWTGTNRFPAAAVPRSEELEADAEHLLDLLDRVGQREDHDAVLRPGSSDDPLRLQHLAVAIDRADAHARRQIEVAQHGARPAATSRAPRPR
jgi:hypothetical protein